MTDIEKERERLKEVEDHIEEAKENAHDLLDPHATVPGIPRSMDNDEPES